MNIFLNATHTTKSRTLKLPENIRILPPPPYPPELNSVERLWAPLAEPILGQPRLRRLSTPAGRWCQSVAKTHARTPPLSLCLPLALARE